MKPLNQMVWIDLETTGLDPNTDTILEIAAIVTKGTNFEIEGELSFVLPLPPKMIGHFHAEVLEMHGRSGLLAECAKASRTLPDVQEYLFRAIRSKTNYAQSWGPICGSSPHFDRRFLELHMPDLARSFSYRTFDVSTLRQAYVNLIQMEGEAPAVDQDNNQHRALADLKWSIEKARMITESLRKGMYS